MIAIRLTNLAGRVSATSRSHHHSSSSSIIAHLSLSSFFSATNLVPMFRRPWRSNLIYPHRTNAPLPKWTSDTRPLQYRKSAFPMSCSMVNWDWFGGMMAGRRPFKDVVKIERGERSCLMVVDMKIEVKYARRMNWRVYILYTLDWPVDLCEQPIQRETNPQIVCIKTPQLVSWPISPPINYTFKTPTIDARESEGPSFTLALE
jgi:hypothetical protein